MALNFFDFPPSQVVEKEEDVDPPLWLSRVQLFATPWTVAHQAPLSTGVSRQENWNGLPLPPPGDLPTQWWNSGFLLNWQEGSLPLAPREGWRLIFHPRCTQAVKAGPASPLVGPVAASLDTFSQGPSQPWPQWLQWIAPRAELAQTWPSSHPSDGGLGFRTWGLCDHSKKCPVLFPEVSGAAVLVPAFLSFCFCFS